jgi:hypothetical protein
MRDHSRDVTASASADVINTLSSHSSLMTVVLHSMPQLLNLTSHACLCAAVLRIVLSACQAVPLYSEQFLGVRPLTTLLLNTTVVLLEAELLLR